MRLRLSVLSLLLACSSCAPRQYSLLRVAGRDYLLPPGMRKAPAGGPEGECGQGKPTTPRASHYALYGCYVQAGFVDLRAGMRLKIVRPVWPKGEALETEVVAQDGLNLTVKSNVTRVETRFVDVRPRAGGVTADVGFAPEITHYRLFFLARDLDRGRKITLIGARSAAALEAATRDLEQYCGGPGAACMAVSEGTVIGPQVGVLVRGELVFVPLGAAVGEAMPPGANAPRLERQWRGKAARVQPVGADPPSLMRLALNGGDSILW